MTLMKQASRGFEHSSKHPRTREFLESMDRVVPWTDLIALIAPCAPEIGRRSR
jgi:IS5 family transposase